MLAMLVRAVVEWDFEVVGADGSKECLRQATGLPIGGHLSAALVELVALHRGHTQSWPPMLSGLPSCRYRDNFFVAVTSAKCCPMEETAQALTVLLSMPVKPVSRSAVTRCLEVRVSFQKGAPPRPRSVLAFRTDADRQGESVAALDERAAD